MNLLGGRNKTTIPKTYNVESGTILIELYSGSVIELPVTGFALHTGDGVMIKTASQIISEKLSSYETANLINIGSSQLINVPKEVKMISKGKISENFQTPQ